MVTRAIALDGTLPPPEHDDVPQPKGVRGEAAMRLASGSVVYGAEPLEWEVGADVTVNEVRLHGADAACLLVNGNVTPLPAMVRAGDRLSVRRCPVPPRHPQVVSW